ncbi:MAG: hypothetical protein IB618_02145 [Candidatus Pacearchaeota archaeon]|nr:MAG: hypothetical protein IB618_02145 [Candidatus Pacearchaeota archaeon]
MNGNWWRWLALFALVGCLGCATKYAKKPETIEEADEIKKEKRINIDDIRIISPNLAEKLDPEIKKKIQGLEESELLNSSSLEFKTDSVSVQLMKDAHSGIATIEILKLKRKPYKDLDEDNISFLTILGHYHYFHDEHDKALENFYQVLNECKERKVSIGGIVFREIAKCYREKKDYQKANTYCLRACEEDEKLINSQDKAEQKEGKKELCTDYLISYKILSLQGKGKEAEEIKEKCINLSKEIEEIKGKKILLSIYAFDWQFYKDKNPELSEEHKVKADSLYEEIRNDYDRRLRGMFGLDKDSGNGN